jgi:hypothetical protein
MVVVFAPTLNYLVQIKSEVSDKPDDGPHACAARWPALVETTLELGSQNLMGVLLERATGFFALLLCAVKHPLQASALVSRQE